MTWLVIRQDDNGNIFVVSTHADEAEARGVAAAFEARGHKQMYSVIRKDELDERRMLQP